MQNLKKYITKIEYTRTKNLLYNIREKFGIDAYLLMKKILAATAITEYYQKNTGTYDWISYHAVLKRNEKILYYKNPNLTPSELIKSTNSLIDDGNFFGVNGNIVIKNNITEVIKNAYDYWNEKTKF